DQIKTRGLSSYLPRLSAIMASGSAIHEDIRLSLVDCVEPFIGKAEADTIAREILNYGILDPDYVVQHTAVEIYKEKLDKDYSGRALKAKTQLSKGKVIGGIQRYRSNPYATIVTERGEIEMELYFDVAPLTVLNFIELAKDGYFEGIIFHRVIPNFVVQSGDPEGFGWGGPGYTIRCEYSEEPYRRGTVGMATSGKDTGGSQFFITHTPLPHLDGRYTVFGQVLVGMDVVDQIVRGDVIKEITIHESKYE
ncbi:MAG: peptidylprolyl isomerase, partial [candidate division Zixibacteria bacterium]